MFYTFVFPLGPLQILTVKCEIDILPWTSNRHLKLNMFKTEILIFPQRPAHLCFLISHSIAIH